MKKTTKVRHNAVSVMTPKRLMIKMPIMASIILLEQLKKFINKKIGDAT